MKYSVFAIAMFLIGIPGLRLLWASRGRSDAAAERLLGIAFVVGSAAIPLRILTVGALIEGSLGPGLAFVSGLSHALLTVTVSALYLFTWRVFHPDSPGVRRFVVAMLALLVANLVWQLVAGAHRLESHPSVMVSNVLRGAVFPWACFESQRYYKMMKKRAVLGLADPVVTNRFALWTIWTGILSILPAVVLATRLVGRSRGAGMHPELIEVVLPGLKLLIVAGFGITCVCLWLSFFPTASYARWLAKDAQSAGARAAA